MTNNMASPGVGKCYTHQYLNLPQMVPLDVQWVTPGAKVCGTIWRHRPIIYTYLVIWHHTACAPMPPTQLRCEAGVVSPLVVLCSLFEFQVWGFGQNLIQYVGEPVLPNVSVEWWIINLNIHGLLDGVNKAVALYPQWKIIHTGMMTCDVSMVIDWGRSLKCCSHLSSKVLADLPYVLLISIQPVTRIPVYYSTFLWDVIFIFRDH